MRTYLNFYHVCSYALKCKLVYCEPKSWDMYPQSITEYRWKAITIFNMIFGAHATYKWLSRHLSSNEIWNYSSYDFNKIKKSLETTKKDSFIMCISLSSRTLS